MNYQVARLEVEKNPFNLAKRETLMKKTITYRTGLALLVLCSAYTPQAAAWYLRVWNNTEHEIKAKWPYLFSKATSERVLGPHTSSDLINTGALCMGTVHLSHTKYKGGRPGHASPFTTGRGASCRTNNIKIYETKNGRLYGRPE